MILYAVYVGMRLGQPNAAIQPFYLPPLFIVTTVNLIAISTVLHLAVQAVRCERRGDLLRYIVIAYVLGFCFFLIQGIGLSQMMWRMQQPGRAMANLYGMTFFLVVVHAAHVVGGMAGLTFVLFGIQRGRYDHERNFPIRFCALYWHFLDIVWLLMLSGFIYAAIVSKS